MDEPSPFEAMRVMDPEPDAKLLDDVLASARELYPQLAGARAVETWAGMIDVMPDETPVIDHVAAAPGLVLATGLSGHGFGLGPGVGALAAQLATGERTIVDPSGFALSRFERSRALAAP
jgi:glycine/D-amino acid oxidase-like deaminating enzyme